MDASFLGSPMSDAELITKFLDGDGQAVNLLIWRWQKPLFNFIYRYVGDAEEAKDLCQQTFIRVCRKLSKLKDHSKFSPWIYSIAANLCKDSLQDRRAHSFVSICSNQTDGDEGSSELVELTDDPHHRPDHQCARQEVVAILQRAMLQLPDEQRVVVLMKEYQELTFAEIAEALNVPLNTVKSRLYYGLHALRKILQEVDIEDLQTVSM